jgi:RNA polymerase sigma-70 factor (ECF subfamily)
MTRRALITPWRLDAAGHDRRPASEWRSEQDLNDAGRRSGGALRLLRETKGGGMAATASSPSPIPTLRGDEEALYRAHNTRLLRLIAHDVSARPQVIEDACAFAWAELLARQPERTSIVGWLRVVALREAIRLAQCDRATVPMGAIDPGRLPDWPRPTSCPPANATDHCCALEALGAVADLPERKRAFLTLKVAGYSYDEIASQLDVSWRTVDRQLGRARTALRAARDAV